MEDLMLFVEVLFHDKIMNWVYSYDFRHFEIRFSHIKQVKC